MYFQGALGLLQLDARAYSTALLPFSFLAALVESNWTL